jgi:hypothetical protein
MPHKRLPDWMDDVKRVMIKDDISVEELASRLNLTSNYIVSVINGYRRSICTRINISKALGLNVNDYIM